MSSVNMVTQTIIIQGDNFYILIVLQRRDEKSNIAYSILQMFLWMIVAVELTGSKTDRDQMSEW